MKKIIILILLITITGCFNNAEILKKEEKIIYNNKILIIKNEFYNGNDFEIKIKIDRMEGMYFSKEYKKLIIKIYNIGNFDKYNYTIGQETKILLIDYDKSEKIEDIYKVKNIKYKRSFIKIYLEKITCRNVTRGG